MVPERISAFRKEAEAVLQLNHRNLVSAYEFGEDNGNFYIAMELVRGEALSKLIAHNSLPIAEAVEIIKQVAVGLEYAWNTAGLIHRDIKPENILIANDGTVKITDLGLAIYSDEFGGRMEAVGSPAYMSPEQFAGDQLDSRSDIYSLGITFFEMVTGELPFNGETFQAVAAQHFSEDPVPPDELNKDTPPGIVAIIDKMMAKLPDDRYASMHELIEDLKIFSGDSQIEAPAVTEKKRSRSDRMYRRVKSLKRREMVVFSVKQIMFVVMFVLVTAAVLLLAFYSGDKMADRLEQEVVQIEQMMMNPAVSHDELEVRAGRIMELFPEKQTPRVHALFWRLKYDMAIISMRKMKHGYEEYKYREFRY